MSGSESSPERWATIPGYEGLYEVSDLGQVRSISRKVKYKGRGLFRHYPGRLLKPRRIKRNADYLAVTLSKDGHAKLCTIHRLVLLAFVGPCPDDMETCHNNGQANDNRLANLRWDTRSNNGKDRILHGTGPVWAGKTHCKRGHEFTPENTYMKPLGRECRACRPIHQANRRARQETAA